MCANDPTPIIVHSAGMARCYRQNDLNEEGYVSYKELNGGKDVDRSKIYPVCLHPKYGGWFGIRALVVFPGIFSKKNALQPLWSKKIVQFTEIA